MFSRFKPRRADVLSHWYSLVPDFNASSKEFYDAIEKELKDRQVPGLDISHVEFAEGSVLSAKREYLRMTRERLVFDICAAPFGTAYFFSCRFAEIPAVIRLWQIIVLLVSSYIIAILTWHLAGFRLGSCILAVVFMLIFYLLRNAVAIGLRDVDAMLIKSPLLGPIYERFFRKETYYRYDTRLMYLDTVNVVVKTLVEETTGAKGITLIQFNEYSPILGELYKPAVVVLKKRQLP